MARIRKLTNDSTSAALRDERIFTVARLEDEELTATYTTRLDGWVGKIDELSALERAVDEEEVRVAAALVGANEAADDVCGGLSEGLLAEVDRDDARYRAFYKTTVSDFARQDFADQVRAMRVWLDTSTDAVFVARKPAIEKATLRGERALKRKDALAARRATRDIMRQQLAETFTDERDALHDDLAKLAREQRLGRSWAASFFKKGKSDDAEAPPKNPSTPA